MRLEADPPAAPPAPAPFLLPRGGVHLRPAPTPNASILVVEDDDHVRELVGSALHRAGYHVVAVEDGESAVEIAETQTPDLVVLDVRLPGIDGWEVCRRIRARADVPVLFLTALRDDASALRGFGLGADDYIGKPFSPAVLQARVEAVLRRVAAANRSAAAPPVVRFADVTVDLEHGDVRRDGAQLHLTATEYRLLAVLAQNADHVVDPRDLIRLAQGYDATREEAASIVKVHLWHLRQKIEPDPQRPRYVLSVRGLGYTLRTDQSLEPCG
ncbi:MAG TPA: response regulator transcription factor [Chloroflexota bacterium]|nr:response regulator transcription factor [Chloroflexota bacterium]